MKRAGNSPGDAVYQHSMVPQHQAPKDEVSLPRTHSSNALQSQMPLHEGMDVTTWSETDDDTVHNTYVLPRSRLCDSPHVEKYLD